MSTVNVSIPKKLKNQAQELVKKGYYASFSDLVRDSLRQVISKSKYDLLLEEAIKDEERGDAVILKTEKDIDEYFDSL